MFQILRLSSPLLQNIYEIGKNRNTHFSSKEIKTYIFHQLSRHINYINLQCLSWIPSTIYSIFNVKLHFPFIPEFADCIPILNNTIPKAATQSNMLTGFRRLAVIRPGQKYAWPDTSSNRLSVSVIRLKMKTTRISVSRPPGRFRSTTAQTDDAIIIDSYLQEEIH